MFEFEAWPKIPRLENETVVITEKIDGTNAQIYIVPKGSEAFNIEHIKEELHTYIKETDTAFIMAGSRNRWISPTDDNFGFARWVWENAEQIEKAFGNGRVYGEWWGQGIQRTYDQSRKWFSYFNVHRPINEHMEPLGIKPVPLLYEGPIIMKDEEYSISYWENVIRYEGSVAAEGYMNPEGICIFFRSTKTLYKVPFNK